MKIRMMLVMLFVLAMTPAVFAQTINLFQPVNITYSPFGTSEASPNVFGTAYITCPVGGTGTLSSPTTIDFNGGQYSNPTGALIVDNHLLVNGQDVNGNNVCPNGGNCYSSLVGAEGWIDYAPFYGYTFVPSIDISSLLEAGGVFTISRVDTGYLFTSTEINLTNTNCTLITAPQEGYTVCHRNNGSKGQKTITVGSQAAYDAHIKHGDTPGPCSSGS